MKKIFLITPFNQERAVVRAVAADALKKADPNAELLLMENTQASGRTVLEVLYEAIETSDLIICDVSEANLNVMYELGYAHALKRPEIVISEQTDLVPFDLRGVQSLIYDKNRLQGEFSARLSTLISEALTNPEKFSSKPHTDTTVNKVFISYSHRDASYLERLMVHLKPLEKEGLVDTWVDTRLRAGDRWKDTIEYELQKARIAILLITADFLASDFIVDNELPPILLNAEARGTKIVPVILKPCRFTRDPNLSEFQAINDPSSPLISLAEADQEAIYDAISSEVERAMSRIV